MNAQDVQNTREIELLRTALQQAETLCATLDLCEFVEPIDFDADIDANRARRGLERRLAIRESAMLRAHIQTHQGVTSIAT